MSNMGLILCHGQNLLYIARVRDYGLRDWTVKSKHRSYRRAVAAAGKALIEGGHKKADVLLIADYYDPIQLIEMVRR